MSHQLHSLLRSQPLWRNQPPRQAQQPRLRLQLRCPRRQPLLPQQQQQRLTKPRSLPLPFQPSLLLRPLSLPLRLLHLLRPLLLPLAGVGPMCPPPQQCP